MILEMTCIGKGIFSIGNMKPPNMMVGSIIPISEINMATCCELVMVDITMPNDKAVMIKSAETPYNKNKLPRIGMPNKNLLMSKMIVTKTKLSKKYGMALASIMV